MRWAALATVALGATLWSYSANGGSPDVAALVERLRNGAVGERRQAAEELGRVGNERVVPPLAGALADDDAGVRSRAESSLWQIWMRSGDPVTDRILWEGTQLMGLGRLKEAVEKFTQVIGRAPRFAEGWNKRATAYYLAGEYEKSIADCERTIELNPYHIGALFGEGLNYLRLGEPEKALQYFRRTLRIHPYSESAQGMVRAIEEEMGRRRRDI